MNDNKKTILKDILGLTDINSESGKNRLIHNFNDIVLNFLEYKEVFKNDSMENDINELYRYVCNLYNTLVMKAIYEFAENVYGQSIDYILMNYPQKDILLKLEKYLNEKGTPQQFKSDIYENIKIIADKLSKRFSFDEIELINLIEASSGNNIITEDSTKRKENKVLRKNEDMYEFVSSENKKVYTYNGESTLQREVGIKSFPMGNKFTTTSTNEIMKKIMTNLFENLNLCIETYRCVYSSGKSVVKNTAILSDGNNFDFYFDINDRNIPHLLGFPRGNMLSPGAINYLNLISKDKKISNQSSSLDILLVIYENQEAILRGNGLYEENGKLYEIINWRKVILKTSSFMRGDFFKTCFCLARINPNRYLVSSDKKGGYVTISSTEYDKGLETTRSARSVLNDLLNTRRQKRDFIFRGIYPDKDKNFVYSIMTGKSENIRVGQENELLQTLQRFRDLFDDSGQAMDMEQKDIKHNGDGTKFKKINNEELFASIVEEIVSERYIKTFTPEEQAELGISISRELSLVPHVSFKALDVLQNVHDHNGAVTSNELDEFDIARSNEHKHKK